VAVLENVLIGAAIPALWLWFLKRRGYGPFQGWWVDVVLVVVLVVMLVIAVRRLSQWAGFGWRDADGGSGRREDG
jgi:hypothetical protein